MAWNPLGLREIWKEPSVCNPCSHSTAFITLSSGLQQFANQTDQEKPCLKQSLEMHRNPTNIFALGNTTLSKSKPSVRNSKYNWSTDHTVSFFPGHKITDICTDIFKSKNSVFLLTFFTLKYKLSTEEKLRKWYKSKASLQIWSKQFQIIWIRSAVCSPSIFWFTFLKLYLSEFGMWKSSVSCFKKASSAMQQKTWQYRNLLFLWDH